MILPIKSGFNFVPPECHGDYMLSIPSFGKNDDDIVRGGGQKVMIGIINENDDNCGPPLSYI